MDERRIAERQRAALASCVRRYATDAHVIDWFNRTYGTKLKAPILELTGSIHEQEQRARTRASNDVDMFVQFIIVVLWPRLQQQIEQPESAPWAGLANSLARRRQWARKVRRAT